MANIGDGRIVRVCDLCGGVDDHPRHVIAGGGGAVVAAPSEDIVNKVLANAPEQDRARLIRDLMDVTSSDRHMDCCRAAGCPDGICNVQTAGAEGKTGKALLTHLMAKADRS